MQLRAQVRHVREESLALCLELGYEIALCHESRE
jgi:hypothetical protein